MDISRVITSVCSLSVAGLFVLAMSMAADGRELVWQGNLDSAWHQGIDPTTGDSNWYTSKGKPFRAPDSGDFAVFPAGAARTVVNVTRDGEGLPRMRFDAAEPYRLNIRSFSTLFGIVTADIFGSLPKVTIFEGKTLMLRNKSRFADVAYTAQILVKPGATLRFTENSRGVDGKVTNHGGVVDFDDDSNAGVMIIRNLSHDPPFQSLIRFYGNSRSQYARFINREDAMLDYSVGRDFNSAKSIENHGFLTIGNRNLDVDFGFSQSSSGRLFIDVADGKPGQLRIYGGANIDGRLIITNAHTLPPATYTIIRIIDGPRTGTFSEVISPGGRIAYGANRVVLIVDPPP